MFKSKIIALLTTIVLTAACSSVESPNTLSGDSLTQIRNATLKINYAGKKILIDPMLAPKGTYPGFPGTPNSHLRNPLVDLPFDVEEVIDVDVIILTHLHPDHWDSYAQKLVPKNKPIFVQSDEDQKILRGQGYVDVTTLGERTSWEGITILRTEGQHGSDDAVKKVSILGKVSGVFIDHPSHKSVYIAGDTIWNKEVKAALNKHNPDVIVLNAGAATITGMGKIIMDQHDVLSVLKYAPKAKVVATHMEAINHCILTRAELRSFLASKKVSSKVEIPLDGITLNF
jgi:L-ascorbate metabolism protein UlaG (beta-lactamase superfamily)